MRLKKLTRLDLGQLGALVAFIDLGAIRLLRERGMYPGYSNSLLGFATIPLCFCIGLGAGMLWNRLIGRRERLSPPDAETPS